MYEEDEFLQLSGIQHFAFCRRQWALAYIEMQWQENVRTVEGKLMHLKAHDVTCAEKRGDLIISRAMPIHSRELGISGECQVVPIEYKRGAPKVTDVDTLQLTAQALCLEEMLCCQIPFGYLYYGETKRRKKIEISDELRKKTIDMFREMHGYYERRYTPRVKWSKGCNACSLRDICLPVLGKRRSAKSYIERALAEEEDI